MVSSQFRASGRASSLRCRIFPIHVSVNRLSGKFGEQLVEYGMSTPCLHYNLPQEIKIYFRFIAIQISAFFTATNHCNLSVRDALSFSFNRFNCSFYLIVPGVVQKRVLHALSRQNSVKKRVHAGPNCPTLYMNYQRYEPLCAIKNLHQAPPHGGKFRFSPR